MGLRSLSSAIFNILYFPFKGGCDICLFHGWLYCKLTVPWIVLPNLIPNYSVLSAKMPFKIWKSPPQVTQIFNHMVIWILFSFLTRNWHKLSKKIDSLRYLQYLFQEGVSLRMQKRSSDWRKVAIYKPLCFLRRYLLQLEVDKYLQCRFYRKEKWMNQTQNLISHRRCLLGKVLEARATDS